MKRAPSVIFWLVAATGAGFWIYDVSERASEESDRWSLASTLLMWATVGAFLEVVFLIVRWLLIKRGSQLKNFGHWTGLALALVMISLALAAWVFEFADPLGPIAFLLGFLVAWFGVGAQRYREQTH